MKYELSNIKALKSTLEYDVKKLKQKMKKMWPLRKQHSVTAQTSTIVDIPYLITDPRHPIFGSQLCRKTKPIFLSKSVPDLSQICWVSRTEDEILQEKAN